MKKKRYDKIKCCLFSALEGNSEAQPITILQRSVSLSTGELTPSVGSKGSSGLSPRGGKKPSIEELRKQVCCEISLLIMYCLLMSSADLLSAREITLELSLRAHLGCFPMVTRRIV